MAIFSKQTVEPQMLQLLSNALSITTRGERHIDGGPLLVYLLELEAHDARIQHLVHEDHPERYVRLLSPDRRNWALGFQSRANPRETMTAVLKIFQKFNVRWKEIGPYNMKCLWLPLFASSPKDTINDDQTDVGYSDLERLKNHQMSSFWSWGKCLVRLGLSLEAAAGRDTKLTLTYSVPSPSLSKARSETDGIVETGASSSEHTW
ncbi:hypothetical protein RHMOL_Rhmol10G0090500 [Rhododendron molle]|uniref:Uncharacterized protein n=1 Tax=Rhododendron molle TaxID=49168 RepID=A0ACC0M119_RHOML|nr:hypothetical protein RHMOL_Rhmol10G0090500 [Rhododendron molle]